MDHTIKNNNIEHASNTVSEEQVAYDNQEKRRLKEAILLSDTDKFYLFTKLFRINKMLQNAVITDTKPLQ
ncbi:MAG: hypothetical protein ABI091_12695 [Ferruginibacter sp.]